MHSIILGRRQMIVKITVKVLIAETIHQLKSVCLQWRRLTRSSKRWPRWAVIEAAGAVC